MRFMILIQSDESHWARMSDAEKKPVYDAHFRYAEELRAAGAFVAGDSLRPSASGARAKCPAALFGTVELRELEELRV